MIPVLITPGDAIDRLTILHLKRLKAPKQCVKGIEEDFNNLKSSITAHYSFTDLQPAFDKLLDINGQLWKLEEDMHSNYLTDEAAGRVGRAIARTNGNRSTAKRAVDELVGVRPEFKDYSQGS